MRVSRTISIYRAQRSQQGCSLSLGMLRLAEPPTGRARLRSSLKSPRNPITPFETSRVATLHPGLYKRLREGARRGLGARDVRELLPPPAGGPPPSRREVGLRFFKRNTSLFRKKDPFPNTRKRVSLQQGGFAQYAMTMPPSLAYIEESAEVGVRMISPMAGHFSRIRSRT